MFKFVSAQEGGHEYKVKGEEGPVDGEVEVVKEGQKVGYQYCYNHHFPKKSQFPN